ncbi:MAG TPA: heme o synthase [Terriglobales bacterium]
MSTAAQPLSFSRMRVATMLRDYAELTKLRVTTLIVMTAWCGYYFAAHKAGFSSLSWGLFHSLLGIALVSSGTAALNEVMEHDVDLHMRRTAQRPIPAGRMSLLHGFIAGEILSVGGSLYLAFFCNPLTGVLAFLTSVVYLAAYTPLKRISPICTFVGAFPGAMPGVLGWTAARGRFDWGTLVLFGILFFWQFPHFFSIAWLYREDYARGEIRMLPVVEESGRSTAIRILIYSLLLIPVSLLPTFLGMAGRLYLVSAFLLSAGLLYFGIRLVTLNSPLTHAVSKLRARQLLQATVIYLPLLFVVMMTNSVVS